MFFSANWVFLKPDYKAWKMVGRSWTCFCLKKVPSLSHFKWWLYGFFCQCGTYINSRSPKMLHLTALIWLFKLINWNVVGVRMGINMIWTVSDPSNLTVYTDLAGFFYEQKVTWTRIPKQVFRDSKTSIHRCRIFLKQLYRKDPMYLIEIL